MRFNCTLFQANLAINPAALLPGATRRVKEPEDKVVSFDEPIQAQTLHSVHKVYQDILAQNVFIIQKTFQGEF